jgi:hypothetical protein
MSRIDIGAETERRLGGKPEAIEARREVERLGRLLEAEARNVTKSDANLARADEVAERARAQLADLRASLPEVSASVLAGEVAESAEEDVLERIAALERTIARCERARPVLDQRRKDARVPVGSLARAQDDAERRLADIKAAVRDGIERELRS